MSKIQSRGIQDRAIAGLVRFFKAEWSGAFLAILILAISIELATSGRPFFHPSNLMTILNNSAAIGIVAAGMTLVIITAGIDLSVGSVVGMTAALTGYVASYWGFSPYLAIAFGMLLGIAIGLFNGTLIAYFGMPAFIVTLAGLSIWRGAGHLSSGAQATPKLPETFDYFGRFNPFANLRAQFKNGELTGNWEMIGGFIDEHWLTFFRTFQMSMLIFVGFFIVLSIIVANTKYGRYVYAIGSNQAGSRQAGINTSRYLLLTYVFGSLCAAFGALLFLGRAPYAKSDYGQMWELDAIAAVVIGGTSLFGGRGSLWGTFMGVILLKLINNGLTLAQLDTFWQMVVTGLIILIAVGLDIVRQSKNPESVRKLLVTIASVMAFLVFLTPGAKYFGSKIALLEHASVSALKSTGEKLASGHNSRLLSSNEIEIFSQTIQNNAPASILFFVLFVVTLVALFKSQRIVALGLAAVFFVSIFALLGLGYGVAIPFLVLGGIALVGSTMVYGLFERARELELSAG